MQNMPIGIFRGDDTDAFSYQTIVGTINTDLDLTGCKAVFRYLGFSMEFDPIPEDKKLTIVIPADKTKKFPPGLGYASLRVYDSEGRLKTFSNRIMVFVATKTPMFGSDEFEVDFNVRASLEPLKFFVGPNPDDFDEYRGYVEKVIDRASAEKYGLAILLDAIDSDLGAKDGVAATPVAVKAAYAAIIEKLTDDYYTKNETDEAIDRVAAYYITRNADGDAFETKAQLDSATVFYSGGKVRTPTRNDYCVVLADETHQGAEYRYIYAVAEGETTGSWQAQFPVEGVMTVDQTVTKDSTNPVSGGGIWSAIWGALASLPTGFSSLYDWCVSQLAGKASKADATLTPIYSDTPTFSEWVCNPATIDGYGVVVVDKSDTTPPQWALEILTIGEVETLPYVEDATTLVFADAGITATRTRTDIIGYQLGSQTDKPLASEAEVEALRTGKANKSDVDPILFARYYPDGSVKSAAEFTAGIKYDAPDTVNRTITVKTFCNTGDSENDNSNLEGRVVIPPFVDAQGNPYITDDGTRYKVVGVSGGESEESSDNLTAVVAPSTVTTIMSDAFYYCTALTSISLPSTVTIENDAFNSCDVLTTVTLPAATTIGDYAFAYCGALTSVDFGGTPRSSVPSLGTNAFNGVPATCKIIVPYTQYDAWIAAENWRDLPQEFVRHSEKADKPATFTTGNLAKFDANGNLVDSGRKVDDAIFRDEAEKGFTEWTMTPSYDGIIVSWQDDGLYGTGWFVWDVRAGNYASFTPKGDPQSVSLSWAADETDYGAITATRTRLPTMADVNAKLDSTSAAPAFSTSPSQQYEVGDYCTHNGKLYLCTGPTTGGIWDSTRWRITELPKLPAIKPIGNLVSIGPGTTLNDSGIARENVAVKGNIPYSLGTPIVINTASSETVEGETVYYGAATLADRTANIIQVTAATALDELRITFPSATSGKVRDFGLRVEIGTGSAALAAPALVPVAPTGETIKIENNAKEIPALADGTATAKGVTLLYFSENAPGVFVVKGEQVEEVA